MTSSVSARWTELAARCQMDRENTRIRGGHNKLNAMGLYNKKTNIQTYKIVFNC